jgi:hypothetical protein
LFGYEYVEKDQRGSEQDEDQSENGNSPNNLPAFDPHFEIVIHIIFHIERLRGADLALCVWLKNWALNKVSSLDWF